MKSRKISHHRITPRLFSNNLLEKLSHVHPIMPVVLFLPLVIYGLAASFSNQSFIQVVSLFFGGIFVWTFAEYALHRFIFHYEPQTLIGQRLHYIIHGIHHEYPADPLRLVIPPVISIPLAVLLYAGLMSVFGEVHAWSLGSGFVSGYIIYDMTHYTLHHFSLKTSKWGLWLKRYHFYHHFRDETEGFGVSSPLWDYVFQTFPMYTGGKRP